MAKTIDLLNLLNFSVVDFQDKNLGGIDECFNLAYNEDRLTALILHRGNLDE